MIVHVRMLQDWSRSFFALCNVLLPPALYFYASFAIYECARAPVRVLNVDPTSVSRLSLWWRVRGASWSPAHHQRRVHAAANGGQVSALSTQF